MTAAQTTRIDVGGHTLRAVVTGTGPHTFVCLHGLVDDVSIWQRLAPTLATRGRVVCVDQRGHGGSDAPPGPYRREDLAADVARVLDHLEVERAVLIGHSMGGIVAMTAALAHPDRTRGLVLLGTASQCSPKIAAWYERIAVAGETDGLAGIATSIYGKDTGKAIRGDAQGIVHVTRMLKSLADDPLTPRLVELSCPVLLLVGETDPMGPKASEIIQAATPQGRATLEVVPGRGHWLHVESPEAVLDALDEWMTKAAPS